MTYLALMRHGQTLWNRVGRFTGWVDEPLNNQGRRQAREAGRLLATVSRDWDVAYTSLLSRAAETAELAINGLGTRPAVMQDWRLNERHLGALEGVLHADYAAIHGPDGVDQMRWAWNSPPPLIADSDPRQVDYARRYPQIGAALPRGESLTDVIARVRPWWEQVRDRVASGERTIVCTHGTTLRALCVLIEGLTAEQIFSVRADHAVPLYYDIDKSGRPTRAHELGS